MVVARVGFVSSIVALLFFALGIVFLGQLAAFIAVCCIIWAVVTFFRNRARSNSMFDAALVFASGLLLAAGVMLTNAHTCDNPGPSCGIVALAVVSIGLPILGEIAESKRTKS